MDIYGNTVAKKGLSSKNISGECFMATPAEAQAVADVITRLLGIPCAWVIVDDAGFDYLNAFGFGSADITPSKKNAKLSLSVRGLI